MSKPHPSRSVLCRAQLRRALLIVLGLPLPLCALRAQHEDDHDHEHLHFSHPIVTESPSPDTKLRLDYIDTRASDQSDLREQVVRLEGEYAFNHSVSLAVVTPFVWRTAPRSDRASALGSIELSLKAASLMFDEHGVLLGGGLSAALPTGSDSKRIGTSHLIELAPFLDIGYKKQAFELVGFARASSSFRRRAGEDVERNLALDFSGLYRILPQLEGLLELTYNRDLVGPASGQPRTFIAPGVKVYPFTNRQIMFGASVEIGTGNVRHTHVMLLSGFYHF
jgi:hypothetical protein